MKKFSCILFLIVLLSNIFCLDFSLYGHKDSVWQVETDGKLLYSVGADGMLKVWDDNLRIIQSLSTHNSWARCVGLYEGFMVVGGYKPDNVLRVYEKNSGKLLSELIGHKGSIFSVVFYKDYIISGGSDNMLIFWKRFSEFKRLNIHDGWIRSLLVVDDWLFSGDEKGRVNIVDLKNFELIKSFELKSQILSMVRLVEVNSNSDVVLIGLMDGSIYKLSRDLKLQKVAKLHEGIYALRVYGNYVVATQGGGVVFLDVKKNFDIAYRFEISPAELTSVTVLKGKLFAGNRQGEVFCYTLDGKYISKSSRHFYSSIRLHADSNFLYVGREDSVLEAYNRSSGMVAWSLNLNSSVRCIEKYKGNLVVTTGNGNVYFIANGKILRLFVLENACISTAADEKRLFLGSYEVVYEYSSNAFHKLFSVVGTWITSAVLYNDVLFIGTNTGELYEFNHVRKSYSKVGNFGSAIVKLIVDEKRLLIFLHNGILKELSLVNKTILREKIIFMPIYDAVLIKKYGEKLVIGGSFLRMDVSDLEFEAPVVSVAFYANSVFVGLSNGRVMELEGTKVVRQFASNLGKVSTLYADDTVVSGHEDGKLVVWNYDEKTGSFHISKVLDDHTDAVKKIVKIGNKIFSASSDKTIKVWDLNSGKLINTLSGHKGYVWALYSIGNYLISGGWDGRIILWDVISNKSLRIYETNLSVTDIFAISNDKIYASTLEGYVLKLTSNGFEKNRLCNDTLWSIDGKGGKITSVYTAGWDGYVYVLDDKLNVKLVKKCHNSTIFKVMIYGDFIITAGTDNLMKIWNNNFVPVVQYNNFKQSILAIAISKSTGRIVTAQGVGLYKIDISIILK
ncbi:MAG: hypothetical protein N2Z58_02365 [Fervidobacterium sp.]|nr:hypothetical protein [Fervidobacterium sp.]